MMHKYSSRLLQVEGKKVAGQAEQRTTMVHALREEPGSYTRTVENGTVVIYAIRLTNVGFIAEWEHATGEGPARSHKEEFSSHADALESNLSRLLSF